MIAANGFGMPSSGWFGATGTTGTGCACSVSLVDRRTGQTPRIGVVVGQPVHVVVQRVQRGCGQHARLAHAATGHLAHAVGTLDKFGRAAQGRAHRCAQALAEADRHTVKALGDALRLCLNRGTRQRSLRHRRIEQARTVQVPGQAFALRPGRGALHVVKRQQLATQGVFQRQQGHR